MNLSDLFHLFRKHVITLICTFIVLMGATCAYALQEKPQYTAQAQYYGALTRPEIRSELTTEAVVENQKFVKSQIEMLPAFATTDTVLEPVIHKLGLNISSRELSKK